MEHYSGAGYTALNQVIANSV